MGSENRKTGREELSTDELQKLAAALNKKYEVFLKDRVFSIIVKSERDVVLVTVTLKNERESFFYPVEGRLNMRREEMASVREATLFLIDYIDLYFEDYFDEGEDLNLPIDWAEYEYDTVRFELRGQVLNLFVERMGDALINAGVAGAELH